jgi:hypothetical protein
MFIIIFGQKCNKRYVITVNYLKLHDMKKKCSKSGQCRWSKYPNSIVLPALLIEVPNCVVVLTPQTEEVRVVLGFSDQMLVQLHHLLCSNHCPLNNLIHLPTLGTKQLYSWNPINPMAEGNSWNATPSQLVNELHDIMKPESSLTCSLEAFQRNPPLAHSNRWLPWINTIRFTIRVLITPKYSNCLSTLRFPDQNIRYMPQFQNPCHTFRHFPLYLISLIIKIY